MIGATRWFLAEGSTGGGFDTWILLQNPQDVNGQRGHHVHHAGRSPGRPCRWWSPAKSRATVRIQNYVPDDFHVSTIVESDVPIVAERSMYWDTPFWGESETSRATPSRTR